MVPQLWLWKVDEVIISAYSMTRGSEVFERWKRSNGEQKGADWKPQIRVIDADVQLGEIMASLVYGFGKDCEIKGVRYPPALDIFENSVVSLLSEATEYMDTTNSSSVNYNKERSFLHALSEVRSELAMIQCILKQQQEVLGGLLKDCQEKVEEDRCGWTWVEAAQAALEKYRQRVEKIGDDTERIEKTINDMLNLKRTYASVKDTHSSVLLSTAVIGFTVITIIFAPLAFLTALLALDIDGFEKLRLNGAGSSYNSSYIGGIFVSSELVTILLTAFAVWGSLWYIGRRDWIQEDANTKAPSTASAKGPTEPTEKATRTPAASSSLYQSPV
ncbi:hypothetical protein GGR52DRAFT_532594 [Hypoxylon sp. FL1284]|nr:hypothetical protein GGR52DRAFT_532594 [Hypoxylon sp. FL1284]